MKPAKFEHVNVTVADPDRTAAMLAQLFGWHVRWKGPSKSDGYTVHVGTDEDYIALYALPDQDKAPRESYFITGAVNHFGILVDDLAAAEPEHGEKSHARHDVDQRRKRGRARGRKCLHPHALVRQGLVAVALVAFQPVQLDRDHTEEGLVKPIGKSRRDVARAPGVAAHEAVQHCGRQDQ